MADEVLDLIRGGAEPPAPAYPSRSMATSAGRKKTKKPEEEDEVLGLIQGTTVPESQVAQQAAATQQKPTMVRQIIGNVLQKGFEAKQAVPAFTASVFDIPAALPQFVASTAAYPMVRAIGGTPEQSKEIATKVASPLEYLKPGKLTGLEETKAYQQSLPTKTMEFIGENIHKGVNWIAEKTGLNPNDVQAAVDVAMLTAPKTIPQIAKTTSKVVEAVKEKLPTVTIERQAPVGGQTGMQSGGSSISGAGNSNSTVNNNTNANNSFNFNTSVQRDGSIKMGANTTSYQQQDVELSKNLNTRMYAVVTEVIRKEKQFGGSLAGIRN
jgi:hypothetical protein